MKNWLRIAIALVGICGGISVSLPLPLLAQQNYNFNVGGLGYSSGPSVPSSCAVDGSWFWLNTGSKAWYVCVSGTWEAQGGSGEGVTSVSGTTNEIDVATGTTTPVISFDPNFSSNGLSFFGSSSTTSAQLQAVLSDETNSFSQTSLIFGFPNFCATDTGSGANVYAIAPTPAYTALAAGEMVCFTPAHTSTGASTLNVNGLGGKSIAFNGLSGLTATATITSNNYYILIYDGNNWQLQTPISGWISTTAGTTNAVPRYTGARNLGPGSMTDNGSFAYGSNGTVLTTPTSITGTSLTTTGLALPAVPVSTTVRGSCHLIWEQSTATATATFGVGMNNAPTDLYVEPAVIWNGTAYGAGLYATVTSNTATNITSTITPALIATGYSIDFNFSLIAGATNAVTLTIYGLTSNTADALVIEPGSYCDWHI
jgi:hypothetical protein